MKKTSTAPVIVVVTILAFGLCCCLLVSIGVLYMLYQIGEEVSTANGNKPFPLLIDRSPTPPVIVIRPPVETVPLDTLSLLQSTTVPMNDLPDLACRLEGKCNLPLTMNPPAVPRQVGEQGRFWVTNMDTHENLQVYATLRYITPHVYFWVEDDLKSKEKQIATLAEAFENKIYPTNRAFFGSEWTPGVDDDPHIYILYARGLGYSIAGYYASTDEYHPLVHEYSNAHEMFVFNADAVGLGEQFTYGVLAHEFQHMIHWYLDRNEESWLNEGFSEVAAFITGYNAGGFDWLYTLDPDLQLNDWPNNPSETSPHYGAGFLFLTYFLDRFGEEVTKDLIANPLNGLSSVDDVLRETNATDSLTNQLLTADDVFMDWVVTNYLMDGSVGDGRYYYHNYPDAPQANATETLETCPYEPVNWNVHQYGVDYIRITCRGDYTLHFEGATLTHLLPADPHSGSYAFWSNKGDESDMSLTRAFDFTGQDGPITLSYWTWYDLEEDYDYLYLEVSEDGQQWQIITTPSGTPEDPTGNNYGWGYNDRSGGGPVWIQETVDLSQYAGKAVQIRFEYVTDAAVNGEGFLLDDVAIPEIGYQTDFEADEGGWRGAGFVRVENRLPQTFRLALILRGGQTTVQMLPVSPEQTADIPLHLGEDLHEAVLVISGTTRFTRELAAYRLSIH